jgi:cystathionine beta-lyase family protein involved in aluminum resistance
MAPSVVGESIKGADLVAGVFGAQLGYPCNPPPGAHRTDIVQAVQLGSREKVFNHLVPYLYNS